MRTALLFPGQGSQTPGMGRAFVEEWPAARAAFDRLDAAVDADLAALCFGDDTDRLRRTEYTQPAVFAVGAAVAAALADRYAPRPALVAGHSLGHITAAAHAGLFTAEGGVRLAAERGAAMARAAADSPGRMVAVLLAPAAVVEAVCRATDGVAVAAYNTDRQTVISGREDAVERACERIRERTRARFADLDVDAAFHSPVMAPAAPAVAAAIEATPMDGARIPIVSDVSGDVYDDPATGRAALRAQVQSPVDWVAVMGTLRARGVERVVELPPAGTLAGFVARTDPEMAVERLDDPADAAAVFE